MRGSVVQVNLSRGGLPKRPVPESLLTPLGFTGDAVAHPQIHGGPEKAVLLVTAEAIEELAGRGYPLFFGALGENLTVRGIERRDLRTGQRFRVGDAAIELTEPRQPCGSLDVYGAGLKREIAADPSLGGYYARVTQTGLVRAGAIILLADAAV